MTVELTAEEIRATIALLDLATKSGGLQTAQHALPIALKLQRVLDEKPELASPEE